MNKLPYRPNVCMIIINKYNKFFLGKRAGQEDIWQFPQGGIEEGYTPEENVYKELEEELGAPKNLFDIVSPLKATNQYDFSITPPYAVGKWRGQSQSFWLVRFNGSDSDINLSRFEPEFSDYQWVNFEEIEGIVEQKRVPGYKNPLKEVCEILKFL